MSAVAEPIERSHSAIAVKKGNTNLLRQVNAALADLRSDGTYDRILASWRPHEVVFKTRGQVRREAWLTAALAAVLIAAVASVFALAWEVRRRRRAEAALRNRQAEIQAFFDNAPAGLAMFDAKPPWRVIAHNRYYQELFAEPFRSRGMVGLGVAEYAPDVEAWGVMAAFDEVAGTRQPKSLLDFPYDSSPPRKTWFNWYLTPILLDGEVTALVSMSLDVTRRHEAETALRESEARLRIAMEAAEQGAWEIDLVSEAVTAGPRVQQLFGVDATLAPVCRRRGPAAAPASHHGSRRGRWALPGRVSRAPPCHRRRPVVSE